ncbi:MAG: 50S ribosomal protein L25 [Actinomycetota bacterium]|nr:50S ribosomal protein L25 [Actinomycetota bacterium]
MTKVEITVEPRSDFGKGAARRIRRTGNIPAVVYGSGMELIHVAIPEHDLDLALRKPRVVLSISMAGSTYLTKPRDVQRDPVKRNLEHVDLVIITEREAAIRSNYADAVAKAEIAAAEAGYDSASVIMALEEAVARGENPLEAVDHAVADVKAKAAEMAAAAAARDAAREATEAEAAAGAAEGEAAAESAAE